MHVTFVQEDMNLLIDAVKSAVYSTNTFGRTQPQIDGETYTKIRSKLCGSKFHGIFGRRMRHAYGPTYTKIQKFIEQFRRQKDMQQKDEDNISVESLMISLAEMKRAQWKLNGCNDDADKIVDRLTQINKILTGETEDK
jgi:hypothetical protein